MTGVTEADGQLPTAPAILAAMQQVGAVPEAVVDDGMGSPTASNKMRVVRAREVADVANSERQQPAA